MVPEEVFFDLPRRPRAPKAKREFWPGAIFRFLTLKGGPKAAQERLRTPKGGQKCPPKRPKVSQKSSKTGSGGHFCLRACISTNSLNFCIPKVQKNTFKNRKKNRVKRVNAFMCMEVPTCIFSRKIQCPSVFA